MIIDRDLAPRIRKCATELPAVTVTGPRQSGKTTLCRALFPDHPYVSLEDIGKRQAAMDDPVKFLAQYPAGRTSVFHLLPLCRREVLRFPHMIRVWPAGCWASKIPNSSVHIRFAARFSRPG